MKLNTLCYIESGNNILMLNRNKKKNDENQGKWIGVGGKLEPHESPDDCMIREVKEETGLKLIDYQLRGIITFVLPKWEDEICFLYSATQYEGTLKECNEGELQWIKKEDVFNLPLWQGDTYFLDDLFYLNQFINIKLVYNEQDELVKVCKYT
ncbi:MAG: 8-oxo-dGTP diphosphatase [Erysipelotrichaceae bacterium]|uniref:NUDIX hydrolase n=1 Tax=Floccifex sp. TaxID=2815810 RepID=UPI002A75DCFF|nr:8-oxo-dGTP diphosphatase [Floccifex sp.]MDD7280428.1 8-oxo-dGTP diphosphatase [Erysipelotrichaceae bacterium]MDY2957570.1 8-oxo-dGTP diphosphatase [Floccifex sp.]